MLWRVLDPGSLLGNLRLDVFDNFQRIAPRTYEPVPVRIIDIDDASLEKLGQWPWPRNLVADLVEKLGSAGAAVVAFDIVFSEADRTSPGRVVALWPKDPELDQLRQKAATLPDHDAILARAFADMGRVVSGLVLTGASNGAPFPAIKTGFAFGGDDPRQFLMPYKGVVGALPSLQESSAGNGSFNMEPDHDATVRRAPLLLRLGDRLVPSLAAEALRVAQSARAILIKSSGASGETSFGAATGLVSLRIGQFTVPTDNAGRLFIHFTRDVPERYVPAWRILDGSFSKEDIEGSVIFVGTSAAGLKDLRASPLSAAIPGVEVHANAVEQILTGHFLERPDWADGAEVVFIAVLGLVLIFVLMVSGAVISALVGILTLAAAIGGSWYAFTEAHLLVDPITPALVVIAVYLASSLMVYIRAENEKRYVRSAFSQYLSPALVEQLANDPDRLRLGGEKRDMTMLFCDVRGFTTISEIFKSDPQGLTRLINRFLTPLTDVILANRGTIDKYMGDCIMAFWNAPLDDPDHAANACRAALRMFDALTEVNERLASEASPGAQPLPPLRIGAGLNSGEVVVGNMGSEQRFDYSVLGDAVNLASRLEGQSKNYGVGIVIGEETQRRAPGFATLELDLIAVKGKTEAIRIFALLGDEAYAGTNEFRTLAAINERMLNAYRACRWQEARAALIEGHMAAPHLSGYFDLYKDRVEQCEAEPPPSGWDGVFRAKEK